LKDALLQDNKDSILGIIKSYKTQTGAANFPTLFAIPSDQRLSKMAEKDFAETITIVTAAITMSMVNLNLRQPLTPDQIVDLADAVIDTAGEDNLALEDLVLFLQQLTRGKYNPLYESMDVPKFMEKFEIYREERHKAVLEMRENQHLEFKGLGDPTRATKPETAFEEHLQQYSQKLQAKNDEIKLLRKERK
jgi:hypothetical protein